MFWLLIFHDNQILQNRWHICIVLCLMRPVTYEKSIFPPFPSVECPTCIHAYLGIIAYMNPPEVAIWIVFEVALIANYSPTFLRFSFSFFLFLLGWWFLFIYLFIVFGGKGCVCVCVCLSIKFVIWECLRYRAFVFYSFFFLISFPLRDCDFVIKVTPLMSFSFPLSRWFPWCHLVNQSICVLWAEIMKFIGWIGCSPSSYHIFYDKKKNFIWN